MRFLILNILLLVLCNNLQAQFAWNIPPDYGNNVSTINDSLIPGVAAREIFNTPADFLKTLEAPLVYDTLSDPVMYVVRSGVLEHNYSILVKENKHWKALRLNINSPDHPPVVQRVQANKKGASELIIRTRYFTDGSDTSSAGLTREFKQNAEIFEIWDLETGRCLLNQTGSVHYEFAEFPAKKLIRQGTALKDQLQSSMRTEFNQDLTIRFENKMMQIEITWQKQMMKPEMTEPEIQSGQAILEYTWTGNMFVRKKGAVLSY